MFDLVDQIAKDNLRGFRIKEDFVSACCPFHKGGQERRPSFWIRRHDGSWGCFSCPEKGSDLRSLLKQLGVSHRSIEAKIEAAVEESKKTAKVQKARQQKQNRSTFKAVHSLPESLLGVFDWAPVDLIEEGFDEEVLRAHDIGFDRRLERITFPIRDIDGTLVGVSGRTVLDEEPKYLVYSGRRKIGGTEVDGELGEWYPDYSNKGVKDHLWRGHLVYHELYKSSHGQLIIVEGYKAALWLVQHGWNNVVALMGAHMSHNQMRMIKRLGAEIFVFLDNNSAGQEGADDICQRLGISSFPVYRCRYPDDCPEEAQPDDFTEEGIEEILTTSERVGGKINGFRRKKYARKSIPRQEGKKKPWER